MSGGWRDQKSQRQNGKAVENQYGFLCCVVCVRVCARVCEGEILQRSRVSVSPHRGEKILQLIYAETEGLTDTLMNTIHQYPIERIWKGLTKFGLKNGNVQIQGD